VAKNKKTDESDVAKEAVDLFGIIKDIGCNVSNDISTEENGIKLSTGLFSLDLILSEEGGFTSGVSEIYGPPGVGKSHVSLSVLEQAQLSGIGSFYINMERGINKSTTKCFPGIDTSKVLWIEPDDGQCALNAMEHILRNTTKSLIILDSIPACLTPAQIDAKSGDSFMAVIARSMSAFMPKAKILAKKNNSHVLLINQCRDNLKSPQGGKLTPGGWAIKYNCDWRIELMLMYGVGGSKAYIEKDGNTIGQRIKAEVAKSRYGRPFQTAIFPLIYGAGFDKELEVVELGLQFGLIKRSGAWYTVMDGEDKHQGEAGVANFLRANKPIFEALKEEIRKLFK